MSVVIDPQVHVVSDGTINGTHVYFTDSYGELTEIETVTGIHFTAEVNETPVAHLSLLLNNVSLHMPLEMTELVKEPHFTITSFTPWYTRLWAWLRVR